jgi:hypothetical protein
MCLYRAGASIKLIRMSGHFHAVRFYKDSDSLTRIVANFLAEGIAEESPAVVIGTPNHCTLIQRHLTAAGIDVDRLQQDGRLIVLDADRTLEQFMVDGMPDPVLFRDAMLPVFDRVADGRGNTVVIRAYGEMVDVLWKAGHTVAATRLEMLWNALARTHAFSLLCGYAMGNFYKDAAVEEICSHHSHVISQGGEATAVA